MKPDRGTPPPDVDDILEDQEFYEAMQQYRHAPLTSQKEVVAAYEAVKRFIRENAQKIVGAP
jgi:hypothetical protein